jgi:hypothetical protein
VNKGVKNYGEYFRSRVEVLQLQQLKFLDTHIDLLVFKFTRLVLSFRNLSELSLSSIQYANLIFKTLALTDDLTFAKKLKSLTINACVIKKIEYAEHFVWVND